MSRRRSAFWGGLLGGALGPTVARLVRRCAGWFGRLLLFAAFLVWGKLYTLTGSAKGALLLMALGGVGVVVVVALIRSELRPTWPTLAPNPHGPDEGRTVLYRFYDDRGALLYVGISENAEERQQQHASDPGKQHWWWRVDHRVDVVYPTRAQAKAAETAAIRGELGDPRPWFNVAEAPSRRLA